MAMKDLIKIRSGDVPVADIDLRSASDDELVELSKELNVGLDLNEMKTIRDHFTEQGRNPTDIELQAFGQAWSEHCCYKSSKPILRDYVFNIKSRKVLAKGDAGVVEFDKDHAYALRIESHNHPSAIGPYGGAATGIGGIIRDILCMGAQPIACIDPLFFGPLDIKHKNLPEGVKHPRFLLGGVVAGIRDYGNRLGIPTVSGGVYFHEGYLGNCLVNVGCVGIAKKSDIRKNAVAKETDIFVLCGGATGRDGIHGVTFASRVLTEKSEEDRGSVQLGDPITKEPLIHACLEANKKGLVNGMKDLGGGGLSCVVGEMALTGGFGAEVNLETVPLKEEGLLPWEIWVSESQERMMLAVSPDNLEEVMDIMDMWDITANVIGKVIPEKRIRVLWQGAKIMEADLDFLTGGPEYCRPRKMSAVTVKTKRPRKERSWSDAIMKLLGSPNICSREWIIRVYDHEVRARTVLKPLQGKVGYAAHGDASVLKPLEHTNRGLAIAVSFNPRASETDPLKGGRGIIDEICRNLAAVGARPDSMTDCLNFGNPEKPDHLYAFHEVVKGMGEVAKYLKLPFPSGNVSFYNESPFSVVPPTAVVLGIGIVKDINKCTTTDLKDEGDILYQIGDTGTEMGGSEYYALRKGSSPDVPDVSRSLLKRSVEGVVKAIEKGQIVACHDISTGGLAITLAEMCMGGDIGAKVDIKGIAKKKAKKKKKDKEEKGPGITELLFSESNTRWVAEIPSKKRSAFEAAMKKAKVPFHEIGTVGGDSLHIRASGRSVAKIKVKKMRDAWSQAFSKMLG
jgi:phosphoribosylformylglycinamidine synthase